MGGVVILNILKHYMDVLSHSYIGNIVFNSIVQSSKIHEIIIL